MHDINTIIQKTVEDINKRIEPELPSTVDEGVPRLGLLGAQAFTQMSQRMVDALREILELQTTEVHNQRAKAIADMQDLSDAINKAFDDLEQAVKEHKEKLMITAKEVQDKVGALSDEMKSTSVRIDKFAGVITDAHDEIFKR